MQAVILAAGRGERMGKLTESTPKPLLEVAGKSLLEHKFDALPKSIDEIILVVGYLGSQIQKRFGGEYKNKKILYVEQEPPHGTAGALWQTKELLKGRFIVMMGDDIYAAKDVVHGVEKKHGWWLGVSEVHEKRTGGSVCVDAKGHITAIEENHAAGGKKGMIGTNLFAFDKRIFEAVLIPRSEGSEEYGLPQTALAASKQLNIEFCAIPATLWIQITVPHDLKKAEEMLAKM